ncbi:hypothetical protein Gotri_003050 [Gossypium trilobum]|uniref:Uncharacterized protein n=1 Tax=Gossypium trilobum TaxID=34281 RepID=A0A7J9FA69_9ROSI|nr:hypothetical protein [Gossypium trilobum]
MAEIGTVTLATHHVAGWDVDTPLPNVFTVAVGSRRFRFRCRPHRGRYCICGDEWRSFVGQNRGAVLTLYAGEGDNATLRLEVRRAEEMEQIDAVNLVANHVHRWRLRDGSGTLPDGRFVLTVTEDENQWWRFECRSEGDRHYITGTEWSRFVQPRIDARLTLYAQQDGENFHRMKVTMRRN